MAFLVGAIVALKVQSAAYGPPPPAVGPNRVQRQPPNFGVVDAAADPAYTVLWQDGNLVATIQATSLDEIEDPDATERARLEGRVVRVRPSGAANSESPGYDAKVVMLYRRRATGAAPGSGTTLALVQTREDGIWRELVSTDLQVVAGQ